MTLPATDGYALLTEKEKQTLRLMLRGHDAKSIARHFDLSVHTINDRLRDARRKLAASSSREAARLLHARESPPENVMPDEIGAATGAVAAPHIATPENGGRRISRFASILVGVVVMIFTAALLALTAQPASQPRVDPAIETTAREFLTLVDQGRWDDSYARTGTAFRKLNSAVVWADVSKKVRPPLGPVRSRVLLSQQNFPAPPDGYDVVKFRTDFANKAGAVETVTLEREDGGWRVVAVIIN